MKQTFIIEHLEPKIWRWCEIEYESASKIVGKNNLWITNVKRGSKKLSKFAKIFKQSVKTMSLKNICVLEPTAKKTLSPNDTKKFKYIIAGGILGDRKLNKRTKKELTQFLPKVEKRNLGKKQFSTDNAIFVAHKILSGTPLKKIKFINNLKIKLNK